MPHPPVALDRNTLTAKGFSPEPEHGALITGLLDVVASDAVPADRLARLGAERLAAARRRHLRRLAAGRALARADRGRRSPIRPRCRRRSAARQPCRPDERHDLGPLPRALRAGRRVHRADARPRTRARPGGHAAARAAAPFTPLELRVIQAIADVLALGLDERARRGAGAGPPAAATSSAAASARSSRCSRSATPTARSPNRCSSASARSSGTARASKPSCASPAVPRWPRSPAPTGWLAARCRPRGLGPWPRLHEAWRSAHTCNG